MALRHAGDEHLTLRHFKRSSFFEGFSRTFDLSGVVSRSGYRFIWKSDSDVLRSDWQAVGNDLWGAFRACDLEIESGKAIQGRLPLETPDTVVDR